MSGYFYPWSTSHSLSKLAMLCSTRSAFRQAAALDQRPQAVWALGCWQDWPATRGCKHAGASCYRYTHARTHMYTHTYSHTYTHTHTTSHTYTLTHIYTRTHARTETRKNTCTHITRIYTHKCTHKHVCVQAPTRTQTHIHTHEHVGQLCLCVNDNNPSARRDILTKHNCTQS
jgi:hypothetical protein